MSLNFNVPPYYDDFDSTKNYYRVLFKPGVAVQARELTQAQTILQDQISKFGNGVYNDGSKITGANIHIDTNVITCKISSASDSFISQLPGLYAVGATSGFIAVVNSVDSQNYYILTKALNVANGKAFSSGETINFYSDKFDAFNSLYTSISPQQTTTALTTNTLTRTATGTRLDNTLTISTVGISIGDKINVPSISYSATVIEITDTTTLKVNLDLPSNITNASTTVTNQICVNAMEVGIDDGVWFTNGVFVTNYKDSIVPDALSSFPSVVIGFEVDEILTNSYSDATLLDPAVGASNYQAPGADRYQITLNLVTKPYVNDQEVAFGSLTNNKFIELVRINAGVVEDINNTPVFSDISAAIASSISDSTGDYIVNPFSILISNGADVDSQNTMSSSISAGKAYISGYPVQHVAPTNFILSKARDTNGLTSQDIDAYYGDYTKVQNLNGSIINFQQGTQVELHNVAFGAASAATKIGTARVRNFAYDSGSNSTTEYKSFLFDVKLANNAFSNVHSLIVPNSGNYSVPTFSANTVSPVTLVDNTYNSLLFPLPQTNIANVSNVNYVTTRLYTVSSFSAGVTTITTNGPSETFVGGTGLISSPQRQINYSVVLGSTSGSYAAGHYVPMDQSNVTININNSALTPQATINIGGNYTGTATIYATISSVNDTPKSKVLVSNSYVNVSANTLNSSIELGRSDIYNFNGIYEIGNNVFSGTWESGTTYAANNTVFYNDSKVYISLTGSNTNHTPNTSPSYWSSLTNNVANYITDNGQRDSYYDHGTITNISGAPKGNVIVAMDYFTHSGGAGYLDVNSYPVSYSNIPSFTSPQYGTTYSLRDVLDFRPRRTDGLGVTTFDSFQLPAPFNNVFANYNYYLSRIDKIVLYPNGQFKTIRGTSAYTNPEAPADVPGAITLFTIYYPAYTFNKSSIQITPTNLRRYTMRDIGLLDKRITNIERYTSLSVLESQIAGQDVTDSTGQNLLFKNGYLTDGFTGSSVGDVKNADYAASIDPVAQLARPSFLSNVASYNVDTTQGTFVDSPGNKTNNQLSLKDNIVTFSYNEASLAFQNVASEIINVNPFNVINFIGSAKLSPASDIWYDTESQPNINIVSDDQAAWLAAVNGTGHGTQWNDWNLNWTGQSTDTIVTSSDQTSISRDTTAITNAIQAQGLSSAINGGPVQVSSTTDVISNAVIPYIRSIPVSFELNGMSPFTKLHTFMNGVCVDSYVTPGVSTSLFNIDITNSGSGYTNGNNQSIITITGDCKIPAVATANVSGGKIVKVDIIKPGLGYKQAPTITLSGSGTLTARMDSVKGDSLTTDENGYAYGTITLPNDDFIKIPTGTVSIEFADNFFTPIIGKSYAKTTFQSQGTLQTTQTTVVSTRPPLVSPKPQVVSRGDTVDYVPPTVSVSPSSSTPTPTYYTNDAFTPGASSYAVGSTDQNNYINAFVNSEATKWEADYGNTNFTHYDRMAVDNVYNNSILPALQSNLPSSYSTPTGSMALAATTYVNQQFIANGGTQAALDAAIASLNQICADNKDNLEAVANSYLTSQGVSDVVSAAMTYAGANSGNCSNGYDPLSQNFFVNAALYPNGVFLSSLDLFFATKDDTIPVSVRIRPTVNGYPDAVNDVPGSLVFLNPSDVNVPSSSAITTSIGPKTTFTFDHPVYLAPGQYSIMVATNSDSYTMYASKMGQVEYGTTKIVSTVTYAGSLFKSQNASTWVPAPSETLCFNMKICEFAGGSQTFDITSNTVNSAVQYDLIQLTNSDLAFNQLDSIDYKVMTIDSVSGDTVGPTKLLPGRNNQFATRQKMLASGDITVQPTLTNIDRWTSPVIDLQRLNTILVENIINNDSSGETYGGIGNGTATAKYITRRVTLDNNFASTGLTVFLDVNRPAGTSIEVYYKVLNQNDLNNFDNNNYVKMTPIMTPTTGVSTTGLTDYTSDTYQSLNIAYNDITTGTLYNNFNVFAIKVVFYSSNPAYAPQIKNFRAVATA